ncbi:MAG: HDIG domain-containing protein [Armatimonadetes bacterium]|nr:HDIG domain-containing protein [Armatimonadota bacterium]MDE2205403.1 HDIG domain-containing protein [Armatimonadota bacterium]
MPKQREDAWNLLCSWVSSESLRKHCLAVEAAMRFYAGQYGEDQEVWGCTGLLHDFDYERNPDPPNHPTVGMAILREEGWPVEMIDAIGGHAEYLGIPRLTRLAHTLYAVDELCGFIMAVAYTRPNRTLAEVEPTSVLKKLKQASFARAVNRDDIVRGAAELGLPLEVHTANCLTAMQGTAAELGL